MKAKKFSVKGRLHSLKHAFDGLFDMLTTEPNAWIHALATVMVLILSWWLQIGTRDFVCIVIAIVSVWMAEAFNTVLELTVDMVSSEKYSDGARRAKDIAAAAVFIATIGASIIGLLVLGPPFIERIQAFLTR